jgi:hypothetical protein
MEASELFTEAFTATLQSLVQLHHSIYPRIPPRDIFFESLVEQAFLGSGWSQAEVVLTTPNSPMHDMTVGGTKLSVKSETGISTRRNAISITKLCTTETGEWNSAALIAHAVSHMGRYDFILMLRAIWEPTAIHYQLLDIPIGVLGKMATATAMPVGKRKGRRSLAVDIVEEGHLLFRVHFDGADGKCQIHKFGIHLCTMLREWDHPLS